MLGLSQISLILFVYNLSMVTIKIYKHHEGYYKSRLDVLATDQDRLLDLIDNLQGKSNLPDDYDFADLMSEALRQHEIEWRLPDRLQL